MFYATLNHFIQFYGGMPGDRAYMPGNRAYTAQMKIGNISQKYSLDYSGTWTCADQISWRRTLLSSNAIKDVTEEQAIIPGVTLDSTVMRLDFHLWKWKGYRILQNRRNNR